MDCHQARIWVLASEDRLTKMQIMLHETRFVENATRFAETYDSLVFAASIGKRPACTRAPKVRDTNADQLENLACLVR